ncbi:MAG TPA: hypothetical protein VK358_18190 [Longimicrobium sp.]|nr:hypothetical protein [Longimicrobium sp.]
MASAAGGAPGLPGVRRIDIVPYSVAAIRSPMAASRSGASVSGSTTATRPRD